MTPMSGAGEARVPAEPDAVWAALLDPAVLRAIIPGAQTVEREPGERALGDRYRCVLSFGVGRLRGSYRTELTVSELEPRQSLTMAGTSVGRFGWGRASGHITLAPRGPVTLVRYWYEGEVNGAVSLSGRLMLGAVSRLFVGRVFAELSRWPYRHVPPMRARDP